MSISFPSRPVTVLDVPEVKSFDVRFVYNFFTTDESLNDSGDVPSAYKQFPAESFDAARIDEVRRVIPRFVRFSFTRVMDTHGFIPNEFMLRPNAVKQLGDLTIHDNLSEIQIESDFAGREFTGLDFQDDNVDKKLHVFVSGSIAKRVASRNRGIRDQIDEAKQSIIDNFAVQHSLLDAARALASSTPASVSNDVIVKALNQIDALKLKIIDDEAQQEMVTDTFSRVKNVNIRAQVSNRFVGKVIKSVVDDPMSTFADEFSHVKQATQRVQKKSVNRVRNASVAAAEYDSTFNAIKTLPIDSQEHPPSVRTLGYIIDKHEILPDGKLKEHPPIIIESPDVGSTIDVRVAYGRTYVYTIRTVAEVRVRAAAADSADIVLGTGLVSSRRSPRVYVRCTEEVPPPPVTDFNVIWNYTHNAPFLLWTFPPNRQRDIKRFQVFRRFSIYEPFQLLREFNFDDSAVKYNNAETPQGDLVENLDSPTTTYLDTEFRSSWSAIYAICSVDAHGLSSNYSMQLGVSFDQAKNRISKQIISYSGAPKSYPNMMLNADTFSDSIKSSGHSRIKLYFDPEFLNVTDVHGADLGLLARKNVDDGKYRLQVINTDLMEQEVVDVLIDDMRPADKR